MGLRLEDQQSNKIKENQSSSKCKNEGEFPLNSCSQISINSKIKEENGNFSMTVNNADAIKKEQNIP